MMQEAGLRAVAAVSKAWAEAGNPPPMTFTVKEWKSSSDIFPMEYADILERHRVLFGDPPFDGIRVSPTELRLQVEHETMGKLLQLRQARPFFSTARPTCWSRSSRIRGSSSTPSSASTS